MTTPHPYSSILHAIAEGKEIQWQSSQGEWITQTPSEVLEEIVDPDWPIGRFRIKPATITINGCEVECPTLGYHGITIQANELNGSAKHIAWGTKEARDAAYAALIKPFESAS